MSFRRIRFCVPVLLLAVLSSPITVAQQRYQLEVIVFEHLKEDGGLWSRQDERPDWGGALDLKNMNGGGFTALSPGSFKMGGVYRVLRSSQNYQPLLHRAWMQQGLPGARARPVRVSSDNGQIEGTVKLRQARFLDVDVDLIYAIGTEKYARLQESRRMKLKELHYFDHPLFGAIIQVTRAGD